MEYVRSQEDNQNAFMGKPTAAAQQDAEDEDSGRVTVFSRAQVKAAKHEAKRAYEEEILGEHTK